MERFQKQMDDLGSQGNIPVRARYRRKIPRSDRSASRMRGTRSPFVTTRPNLDTTLLHGRRGHKRALRKQKGCFVEEQAAGCFVIGGVSVSWTHTNADLHVWTQHKFTTQHTLYSIINIVQYDLRTACPFPPPLFRFIRSTLCLHAQHPH